MLSKLLLFSGILSLVIFTNCDWCKKCKEKITKKNLISQTTYPGIIDIKNKEEFNQEVLKSKKLVVANFSADFCGACKEMRPIFEDIAKEFEHQCRFVIINKKEDSEDIFISQKIRGVPTFILYKNGEDYDKFVGLMSKKDLRNSISKALEELE